MAVECTAAQIADMERRIPWFREKREVVHAVIATLPGPQVDAFRMLMPPYFGPGMGLSKEEIAAEMGITVEKVNALVWNTAMAIGNEWRKRKGITAKPGPRHPDQPMPGS